MEPGSAGIRQLHNIVYGARMGENAVDFLTRSTHDANLLEDLAHQRADYQKILNEAEATLKAAGVLERPNAPKGFSAWPLDAVPRAASDLVPEENGDPMHNRTE